MTHQFRSPGPLGLLPGAGGGRLPGPLGYTPGVYLAPNQLANAVKKLKMPPPASDSITKAARNIKWNLFAGKSAPALRDVKQGALANCPLAALLAALAFTPSGKRRMLSLVAEHKTAVETDLSSVAGSLADSVTSIKTDRYFTVTLGGASFEVSSVLYTDEARDPNPIYMTSPSNALWPCVIEKAFAEKVGGYNELDDSEKLTLNTIWEVVMGSKPDGFAVTDKTPFAKIQEAAKKAGSLTTVAASSETATDVTTWHGFAVLGIKESKTEMKKSEIKLYDPSSTNSITLSLEAFRKNFIAILYPKS